MNNYNLQVIALRHPERVRGLRVVAPGGTGVVDGVDVGAGVQVCLGVKNLLPV